MRQVSRAVCQRRSVGAGGGPKATATSTVWIQDSVRRVVASDRAASSPATHCTRAAGSQRLERGALGLGAGQPPVAGGLRVGALQVDQGAGPLVDGAGRGETRRRLLDELAQPAVDARDRHLVGLGEVQQHVGHGPPVAARGPEQVLGGCVGDVPGQLVLLGSQRGVGIVHRPILAERRLLGSSVRAGVGAGEGQEPRMRLLSALRRSFS